MEDSKVLFGAERLGRRRFLVRTSAGVLTLSALDALVAGSARVFAQATSPEDCPAFDAQLQSLVDAVDAQIVANCPSGNRLNCAYLLTPSEVSSFSAQLATLDSQSTAFSCATTATDQELIQLSGLNTSLPGFVSLFQGQGFSARAVVCPTAPGIPALHPFGMLALGSALAGLAALWLHRRKIALGPGGGALPLALAGAPLLFADRAQAQSVQLVDVLEQCLGNRCLARILAVPLQTIVPINEALALGESLRQVKDDPDVAAELTGVMDALGTIRGLATDYTLDGIGDAVEFLLEKLTQLMSVLVQKQVAVGATRDAIRGFGKRLVKCIGFFLVVVDIGISYADEWDNIKADCGA